MLSFANLFSDQTWFITLVTFLYIINFFLSIGIIFLERKNPSATLAWIMVLLLVPIVGIVFYFFFSQNITRRRIYKVTQEEKDLATNSLSKQKKRIVDGDFEYVNEEERRWEDLIRLNQSYGRAYLTQDNEVEALTDGRAMFDRFLKDIKNAGENINVMYFILKTDAIGQMLIDALTAAARRGVKVRLLVDALGSRQVTKHFLKDFLNAGGEFARFFPPKIRYLNTNFNYRNHRKLVIIDDKIGYIGGFNIANEYLGYNKKFGYWRDTFLRIRGGSVLDMNGKFLLDWRAATRGMDNDVNIAKLFYEIPEAAGNSGVQIVSSGPDTDHEEIKRAFMKMISAAEKNIYIQTPYFVPDEPIQESLKMAAQSGVDVRIMIPCMPDHVFVYWATYSYIGDIIRNGGRAYIYDGGFLHAKTMMVDGQVCTVGSTNFDRRSFKLNWEGNAFIYDGKFTRHMENIFINDIRECHELTKELYENRDLQIKIKEPFCRVLSDVL